MENGKNKKELTTKKAKPWSMYKAKLYKPIDPKKKKEGEKIVYWNQVEDGTSKHI